MRQHLYLIFLPGVAAILGLYHWRNDRKGNLGRENANPSSNRFEVNYGSENRSKEATRTKSKDRPNHPKPSIEETTELLKSTIIAHVDFPADQSVTERVALFNELIQKEGIEPHRLRIVINATDPAQQMRFRDALRVREIPASVVLKYSVGNTKLRYRVLENGVVELISQNCEFRDHVFPDDLSDQNKDQPAKTDNSENDHDVSDEEDPFASPREKSKEANQ